MCLQAHYRSELEFSWEGLSAALTRLKRLVMGVERLRSSSSRAAWPPFDEYDRGENIARMDYEAPLEEGATRWGDYTHALERFEQAISNDLNTADALVTLDEIVDRKKMHADDKLRLIATVDGVLGLGLVELKRAAGSEERR